MAEDVEADHVVLDDDHLVLEVRVEVVQDLPEAEGEQHALARLDCEAARGPGRRLGFQQRELVERAFGPVHADPAAELFDGAAVDQEELLDGLVFEEDGVALPEV